MLPKIDTTVRSHAISRRPAKLRQGWRSGLVTFPCEPLQLGKKGAGIESGTEWSLGRQRISAAMACINEVLNCSQSLDQRRGTD